jgi:signal transduction histidine kinase
VKDPRDGWSPRDSARQRLFDVAALIFAGLVAILAVGEAQATGRITGTMLAWSLVLTAVGCGTLWWRHDHPVAVAIGLAAIVAVTEFVGGAVLVAVYTVAANRDRRTAILIAGLHAVVVVPYSIVLPDPDLTIVGANLLSIALLSGAVMLGRVAHARRDLVASLRERAAQAEATAGLLAERARARERQRIAREMHDVLAHRISQISLYAGALEIREDLSTEEVSQAAGVIRENAHKTLEDLREILGVLRVEAGAGRLRPPADLDDLSELITECSATGTQVEVDDRLPARPIPAMVGRTGYRVVREGLTNARKHAPRMPVRLLMERTPGGELHLWLRNDLPAVPVQPVVPGARVGLLGLAERVELAGGRVVHGPRRGASGGIEFHLETWIPWPT